MKMRFKFINLLVGAGFAVITFLIWGLINRPASEPPWPSLVEGMSFSPLRQDDDPATGKYPSREDIAADLALLAGKVRSVRTYGVGDTLAGIPELAAKHDMTVTLGGWLSTDLEENERELAKLIAVARANHRNVTRVIIGNETVLRGDLTPEQLIGYLDRARAALKVPVSTGEPWHVWIAHPELAGHVDYIAAHFLPYWEGVDLNAALGHIAANVGHLRATFPGLPVLLAEVGWPSNGRTRRSAVASEANEAIFLRRFLAQAQQEKYDYFLMEAFDQPWKTDSEGSVGAYWGVYDVFRHQKFAFVEPIVRIPQWRLLAGISVVLAIAALSLLLVDSNNLRRRGRSFLAATAHGIGGAVVWTGYDYANQYLTPVTILVGVALAGGYIVISLVLLAEAHEMAEASWMTRRRRPFGRRPAGEAMPPVDATARSGGGGPLPSATPQPKVSIHVPAYNEPPEMMKATLDALARLDYEDYEVLVVDNNTKDPAVWQPVEHHCRKLGPRFRFFHVDPLAGFKAGALNYALARTAPDAEVVAVIDSDYQVRPAWLRDLVPHFRQPEIGFVQAPQDYRDGDENAFKSMCEAEYQGFFHIGMVTRNDRNAIIEHGTMTMIRVSVLKEVGGWAEWCITEDAELGLRIFEHGYEGAYVEESYGKGVMPDTFVDYKKQRYRWAYGAIQILKRHRGQILGTTGTRLSPGQRYHFLAGWLPWLADGLNLLFTLTALLWSAAMIVDPRHVDPPLAVFMIPPVVLFVFKVFKLFYLYRVRLGATQTQAASAALAGLALSHTIAKAVLSGLFTRNKPFFRTPKCENRPALVRALAAVGEEAGLTLLLWGAACGVAVSQGPDLPGSRLWAAVLLVQSMPYLAALLVSLTNVLPGGRSQRPPVVAGTALPLPTLP